MDTRNMDTRNNYNRSPPNRERERSQNQNQNYRSRENSRNRGPNSRGTSPNPNRRRNENYPRQRSDGNMNRKNAPEASPRMNNGGSRRNMNNKMDSSRSLNSPELNQHSQDNYNNNNYNNNYNGNNNSQYNSNNSSQYNVNGNNNNNNNNNYYGGSSKNSRNNSYNTQPPVPNAAYSKENSYKQFNSSSTSLNASANNLTNRMANNSNTNLLQSSQTSQNYLASSPFQNPYKDNKPISLDKYPTQKKISPTKFFISLILAIAITIAVLIIGIMAIFNKGLSAKGIYDVNNGIAQGYLFYVGFMVIAIATGLFSYMKKWNNLLITYCSFLFVSIIYLGYFVIDILNISRNSLTVMEKRWKNEYNDNDKLFVQVNYSCCGYLDVEDDSVVSDDCYSNDSLRKRGDEYYNIITPNKNYNYSARFSKRQLVSGDAIEGGCALEIMNLISSKIKIYIIIFIVLIVLNIAAAVSSYLNIKEYTIIMKEMSNPFA